MEQANAKPLLVTQQKSVTTSATGNKANKKKRRPKPPADLESIRAAHREARRAFLEVAEEASRCWNTSVLREQTNGIVQMFMEDYDYIKQTREKFHDRMQQFYRIKGILPHQSIVRLLDRS